MKHSDSKLRFAAILAKEQAKKKKVKKEKTAPKAETTTEEATGE